MTTSPIQIATLIQIETNFLPEILFYFLDSIFRQLRDEKVNS